MTPRPLFKLLALAGGFSFALPALHAQIVPGSQSNVTLTLTASYTGEELEKTAGVNTVYSASIVKEAFNNKVFIAAMNEGGYLPDNTITGWKLVMVNSDPEDEDDSRAFYLVKTGQTPVPVPSSVLRLTTDLPGFAEAFTDTENANSERLTGKTTFRGQVGLAGSVPGDGTEFSMVGVIAGSDKSGPVTISKAPFKFIYQLVTAKLSGIVGAADDSEDPEGHDLLLEGSVSFSAETPIDISSYPPADSAEPPVE